MLEAAGLSLQDDPYASANDGRFGSDTAGWPQHEYGHIFSYVIQWPRGLHLGAAPFLEAVRIL